MFQEGNCQLSPVKEAPIPIQTSRNQSVLVFEAAVSVSASGFGSVVAVFGGVGIRELSEHLLVFP